MRAVAGRVALAAALLLSWLALLPLLWRAFATVPSAERLQQSHLVRIPTIQSLWLQIGISALELAVLLLLLWPWWSRRYVLRLWAAALGTVGYFFATVPLGLSSVEWIHRRWLALVGVALLAAAIVASMRAVMRSET